ncbi:MAG: sigma 54-interacting transcriptional regulator [Rickettsiales bacterium]|nr:sigma 54-interacting transcriptional regulator [Rickettsiales bacterium]
MSFNTGERAVEHFIWNPQHTPEVIIIDASRGDMGALALVRSLRKLTPNSRILLLVSLAQRELALEALQCGGDDYLFTPITSAQMEVAIQRLKAANPEPALSLNRPRSDFESIIGSSAQLTQLLLRARAYSHGGHHILLRGERGVGKTHLAYVLHQNMVSNPPHIHSYKSASTILPIIEQQAAGSAVIIDLPDRPLLISTRQHELRNLCDAASLYDVRLIFCQRVGRRGRKASLPDICPLRLVTLNHPPLRVRPEDISAQLSVFSRRSSSMFNRPLLHFTDEARLLMLEYDWPGNSRELHYIIFQLYMTMESLNVTADMLRPLLQNDKLAAPSIVQQTPRDEDSGPAIEVLCQKGELRNWEEIEADYLRHAFQHYDGHKSKIALKTGLGRSTLYRKAKNLDIV